MTRGLVDGISSSIFDVSAATGAAQTDFTAKHE
jgi:hypothetical protein